MYATLSDLLGQVSERVLVSLTDDEGTGQIHTGRVEQAIADASARIDAYCQARYTVPFAPVPDVIRRLCVDIAIYNLFSRRGFEENSADEAIIRRYKDAVRMLEQIATGAIRIGAAAPAPSHTVRMTGRPRIFGSDLDAY